MPKWGGGRGITNKLLLENSYKITRIFSIEQACKIKKIKQNLKIMIGIKLKNKSTWDGEVK